MFCCPYSSSIKRDTLESHGFSIPKSPICSDRSIDISPLPKGTISALSPIAYSIKGQSSSGPPPSPGPPSPGPVAPSLYHSNDHVMSASHSGLLLTLTLRSISTLRFSAAKEAPPSQEISIYASSGVV